jgi:two-component system, chemotaxis family, CheB/CheR fusion protein
MPPQAGMAFVIIQHLSPKHKSILGEILKKDTQMKVMEVQDGMAVESDCVYFNPPDKEVAIFNGILHLMEPAASPRVRMPIDYFFRSLAGDQGERAICIILSGTGSDGTLGMEEVKGAGGMTMAQAEFQAKYPFMPKSAIDTGQVDYVLPVEQMPQTLIKYIKHPYIETPEPSTPEAQDFQIFVPKILLLIRTTTRHDFTHYKSSTIRRRIERRMAVHRINLIADYYRYLQENPAEIQALFKDLIICVTSFFRDPRPLRFWRPRSSPKSWKETRRSSVRVWVPGCGTGEEALSLAILFSMKSGNVSGSACRYKSLPPTSIPRPSNGPGWRSFPKASRQPFPRSGSGGSLPRRRGSTRSNKRFGKWWSSPPKISSAIPPFPNWTWSAAAMC